MNDQNTLINGLTVDMWEACYRPGIPEFSAVSWVYTVESPDTVRLVFGNLGPYKSDGSRQPVFTNAVTLPANVVVELAEAMLRHFAAPADKRPKTSGEN
jgi:hypothetical protein